MNRHKAFRQYVMVTGVLSALLAYGNDAGLLSGIALWLMLALTFNLPKLR